MPLKSLIMSLSFNCIFLFIIHFCAASSNDPEYAKESAALYNLIQQEHAIAMLFTQECCSCTDCVEAEVLMGGMSKEIEENLGIVVVRLKSNIKAEYGVKKLPTLAFTRNNRTAFYQGKFEYDDLYQWLQDNNMPAAVELDDYTFEHYTQASTGATTGDWLVLFHDNRCVNFKDFIQLETAAAAMRNRVNVASVDITVSPESKKRFHITLCPEVIFFRLQKMYRFTISDITFPSLIRFATGFYKNSKAEKIIPPQTVFDKITDKTVDYIKENTVLCAVVASLLTFLLVFSLYCYVKYSGHSKKD